MKLTEEKLKELMQNQTARSTSRQVECLTEDHFSRALTKEMGRDERLKMAEHLAVCADCAQEYRILRSLKPWSDEAKKRLGASMAPQSKKEPPPIMLAQKQGAPSSLSRFISSPRTGLALAASLLIALTIGAWLILSRQEQNNEIARLNAQLTEQERSLAATKKSLEEERRKLEAALAEPAKPGRDPKEYEEEIARLRRRIAELARPQLDVPIVDLDPADGVRGEGDGSATKVDVPSAANSLTLILNFSGREQYSSYFVEILNERGRTIWRGQQTRSSNLYSLNLTLSRSLIPEGRYLIKLYGLNDGEKKLIADYSALIDYR